MNNKNIVIGLLIVIVVLVGGYGAYRLYNHYHRLQTARTVATAPAKTVKPTATPTPSANVVLNTATNAKLGTYYTDLKGMTLYTFSNDKPGVSNCNGACLTLWPAYTATSGATNDLQANVSTIKRSNGAIQYTYKGMPLYYYYLDKKPGDTLGQGVKGVWFVAKP